MASKKSRKTAIRELPISKFIPNLATLSALCTGLTGLHFAMQGQFEMAVMCVFIASILDVLDGRLARMLGAESDFGAQMDSLSDFVCFGVVPGVMIYTISLQDWKGWGWGVCLFYVMCACWRLARFNTLLKNPDKNTYRGHFMGMPVPMGAYTVLLPMMLSFVFDFTTRNIEPVYAVMLVVAGLLMVSPVPTIATKNFTFTKKNSLPILLVFGSLVVALLNAPWEVLSIFGVLYLAYIPIGILRFKRAQKK